MRAGSTMRRLTPSSLVATEVLVRQTVDCPFGSCGLRATGMSAIFRGLPSLGSTACCATSGSSRHDDCTRFTVAAPAATAERSSTVLCSEARAASEKASMARPVAAIVVAPRAHGRGPAAGAVPASSRRCAGVVVGMPCGCAAGRRRRTAPPPQPRPRPRAGGRAGRAGPGCPRHPGGGSAGRRSRRPRPRRARAPTAGAPRGGPRGAGSPPGSRRRPPLRRPRRRRPGRPRSTGPPT